MDIQKLSEFIIVGQMGSIRRAAGELHLSPATLVSRMHAFERELGVTLLEDRGLTEAGKRLMAQAPEIVDGWQSALAEVAAAKRHTYRHLRICLPETTMPLFLGPFLDQLNRTWPDLHIDLMDGTNLSIQDALCSGEVDVFFAVMMDRAVPPGVERYDFARPNHHVLLPASHPLAQRSELRLRDLDGESFILAPNGACACVRNFQLTNLAAGRIRYSLYDSLSASSFSKLLVPIGKGLFLSPSPIPDLPPNTASVIIRELPYPVTPCFFVQQQADNADSIAFTRDFLAFAENASMRAPFREGKMP